MGEIADMMLDGTMDPETGEWNFDGEDGPGWPMTGAEATAYKSEVGGFRSGLPGAHAARNRRKRDRKRAAKARKALGQQ